MMKRIIDTTLLGAAALFFMAVLAAAAPAYSFEGPLQVRSQFPLFMHADASGLESARTNDAVAVGFSYSSVYLNRQSVEWNVLLDLEMAVLDLQYRKVVAPGLELGIRVPVINFNGGFMDGFLDDFHKTFDLPDYSRSERPRNEFAYEVSKNGQRVIKGTSGGAGLGDVRLSVKKLLLSGDPAVSISAGLELPTGDAHKGYGNGSLDADLAVMVDKQWGPRLMAYFNAGIIFPGDVRAEQRIELKEFFYAAGGLEYLLTSDLGLLAQATFQTSPYPKTGVGMIDRAGFLGVFGIRYTKAKDSIELSMTEDLNTAGANDFTLHMAYKRRF
ncbi:MAG: hypothetical protein C0402_01130 [Thermodesulfovibrio sp.]|nr:hypothetical protein [Thermodesulfovibrio sp.]